MHARTLHTPSVRHPIQTEKLEVLVPRHPENADEQHPLAVRRLRDHGEAIVAAASVLQFEFKCRAGTNHVMI